jgi:hypothetical protein
MSIRSTLLIPLLSRIPLIRTRRRRTTAFVYGRKESSTAAP